MAVLIFEWREKRGVLQIKIKCGQKDPPQPPKPSKYLGKAVQMNNIVTH